MIGSKGPAVRQISFRIEGGNNGDPAQSRARYARRSPAVRGGFLAEFDDRAVQSRAGSALSQ
jgi:hypothetical protein